MSSRAEPGGLGIRFDINDYSPSGPGVKGDFTIERRLMIARKLLDQLGVDRHSVGGSI